MKKHIFLYLLIFSIVVISNCSKDGDINFFTVNQDKKFGEQVDSLVNNDSEYTVLPRSGNKDAYSFLDSMMNDILSSKEILYRDKFEWEVTIIEDEVLNAFAAPGGKLFFYTGLMKYLDNSAELAGVMAHEIAHSDRRHSTENMTKAYGFSILLSVVLGKDPSKLEEIVSGMAKGLSSLAFSRKHEYEADEFAVRYTSETKYTPTGVAGFFQKLEAEKESGSGTPTFLSTHPSPDDRIEKIYETWEGLGSPQGEDHADEYVAFKALLP